MDNEELKEVLYRLVDALWVLENIEKLPNCNNCKWAKTCADCPGAGEMVRVNCVFWGSEREENNDR